MRSLLQRRWRVLSGAELAETLRLAESSVDAFTQATAAAGSLLQSWIGGQEVVEMDHYPPGDLIDPCSGCQFYYHSHRQDGMEHGHLHLF